MVGTCCLLRGILVLALLMVAAASPKKPNCGPGPWKKAKATFYGNPDGSGTFEGACGYGDVQGFKGSKPDLLTAALSATLFKDGATCGSCYEIKCDNAPQGCCKRGAKSVIITATNLCPDSGWCSPPNEHFDMSQPAFLQIAEYKAGVVPVKYRRVPCKKKGGIRFTISKKSNPWFLLVMVWNVAGSGDVKEVQVKGSDGRPWCAMKRNFGLEWESHENLVGQKISFRVITSDGKVSTSSCVTPENWQFGQTYEGKNLS